MKKILYIGTKTDKRNIQYMKTLKENAKFDYTLISIEDLGNYVTQNNHLPIFDLERKYDFIRILAPWNEKKLVQKFKSEYNANWTIPYLKYAMGLINAVFPSKPKFNTPESAILMRDKRKMGNLFIENEINTPQIYNIGNIKTLLEDCLKRNNRIDQDENHKIFVKLTQGSLGVGLGIFQYDGKNINFDTNIFSTTQDFESYKGTSAIEKANVLFNPELQGKYIWQDYINMSKTESNEKFDVRIINAFDKTTQPYARVSHEDSVSTNIAKGAEPSLNVLEHIPQKHIKEAIEMSKRVGPSLETNMWATDIVFDKNHKPVILEANAFPKIDGIMSLGINPYEIEITELNKKLL
jgi:glutathione synthase/RimK-type ligase-like ATP-grasp enzyme